MKKIITVQDISCIGKCSLTVALPILSAMGLEVAVIPTAVLSAHTAFDGFTFHDLTEDIPGILAHWRQQKLTFDAIYTGYLGSVKQLSCVQELLGDFRTPQTLVLVDPVMGDNGKLYTGFSPDFPQQMARLCSDADVIVPNLTEACALLDIPYTTQYTLSDLQEILRALAALGAKNIVLTGISLQPGECGVLSYESATNAFFSYFKPCVEQVFHGTGDVFASTLTGALTSAKPFTDAVRLAVDFTVAAIHATTADPTADWYGINFESVLPLLWQQNHRGEDPI